MEGGTSREACRRMEEMGVISFFFLVLLSLSSYVLSLVLLFLYFCIPVFLFFLVSLFIFQFCDKRRDLGIFSSGRL